VTISKATYERYEDESRGFIVPHTLDEERRLLEESAKRRKAMDKRQRDSGLIKADSPPR